MAWTDGEEVRIQNLETVINDLQTAVQNNLASKLQMRQLLNIKQEEITALETRVTSLETQIAVLQSSQD